MATFQYLEEDSLFDAFNDASKYMRPLFEPLAEFERIARNKPHPGLDKAYPHVTDGTTSSVIEKTPRRILQQVPTGLVETEGETYLPTLADWVLRKRIIPNDTIDYPFLQKMQAATSKALTYGAQPIWVQFVNNGTYFGTITRLPYVKDVFFEPGKLSDDDCNYMPVRAWYQPRDIDKIIHNAENLQAKGIDTGWDTAALKEIRNQISQKDDLATTPNEKDKNNRQGGVEIIHMMQKGIGATFYSIHMKTKKILRRKVNPDPRGVIPIHYLYSGIDMSNPLGRGFIEMVGAMQNLMDAEVQMYQYNRALMLNPPMVKKGNWNKNQAKLAPNVLVDLGSDPNAAWEPVTIDSSAIAQFSQNYGLMQSQILNLLSSPNAQISAEVGSQTQSKTQAGVKQQTANLNVDDTYIRNMVEACLGKVFETELNIYFAEKQGVEEVKLDVEAANELREIQADLVNEQNVIRVDWSKESKKLAYHVEPGSSEQQDDQEEIAQLKEILADVNANPYTMQYVQQAGKDLNLGEVYKQLFEKLNLEGIDKILTDIPTGPDGQKQSTPPMAIDKPKLTINYDSISSPTIKAALLQNAGIQADPNDIAQSDQQQAQMQAAAKAPAQDPNDISNHPMLKLMSSLNIKFTDLPEDSKHEVLQIIGIPSQMDTPVQVDHSLKAIDAAHTITSAHEQQANQEAQLAQADQHKQLDAGLQQQSQDQQAQQNEAQNQLTAQGQQQTAESSTGSTGKKQALPTTTHQNPQPALTPEDHDFITQLQGHGFNSQQVSQALAMLHHGYPVEDILQMLQGAIA